MPSFGCIVRALWRRLPGSPVLDTPISFEMKHRLRKKTFGL